MVEVLVDKLLYVLCSKYIVVTHLHHQFEYFFFSQIFFYSFYFTTLLATTCFLLDIAYLYFSGVKISILREKVNFSCLFCDVEMRMI